ncbi:MAG: hypothetical protein O7C75_08425, partial [Verrucomicrobia bacterium]|nr:hypothetical protein [Verrucomicrobiota bacterium]
MKLLSIISRIAVGIFFLWLLSAALTFAAEKKILRAGSFAIDITPKNFPVESAGSMTPRVAISAHDPLYARCLVLDNGDTRIAFATCDSCMIPREIFDAAKKKASAETGIPIENILASATHTHTAVCSTPAFQSNSDLEYREFLKKRIAEGIVEAASRLEPARIG